MGEIVLVTGLTVRHLIDSHKLKFDDPRWLVKQVWYMVLFRRDSSNNLINNPRNRAHLDLVCMFGHLHK